MDGIHFDRGVLPMILGGVKQKWVNVTPEGMRNRIYDTPDVVGWATEYLLNRLYDRPSRDDVIRERYARGERLSALARAYGLSPARIHQIVHHAR